MENYNIYLQTENEKYSFMNLARSVGALVTSVSGCGSGYYITIDATASQVAEINTRLEAGA